MPFTRPVEHLVDSEVNGRRITRTTPDTPASRGEMTQYPLDDDGLPDGIAQVFSTHEERLRANIHFNHGVVYLTEEFDAHGKPHQYHYALTPDNNFDASRPQYEILGRYYEVFDPLDFNDLRKAPVDQLPYNIINRMNAMQSYIANKHTNPDTSTFSAIPADTRADLMAIYVGTLQSFVERIQAAQQANIANITL